MAQVANSNNNNNNSSASIIPLPTRIRIEGCTKSHTRLPCMMGKLVVPSETGNVGIFLAIDGMFGKLVQMLPLKRKLKCVPLEIAEEVSSHATGIGIDLSLETL